MSLLALAACGGGRADAPAQAPESILVQVVAAVPVSEAGAVRASGMVGYKRETPLSFSAPGVIAALSVDEGDVVRAGQRLATLRRTSVGANAEESALARATAQRNLQRTQTMFDQGFVSQAALDDARLAASRASDSAVITAPVSGVILRRSAEPAQTVSAGQAVYVLGDVGSGIIVRAAVSAQDAARVHVGDAAEIRAAGLSPMSGEVARIGAKSDDATGGFEIEVRVPAPGSLRSGQVAEVIIAGAASATEPVALLVPALSLIDARADQAVVFVVDERNIARRRAVETAGLLNDGVLIVAGLQPGERVIAAGAAYVRDGDAVRIAPRAS